MAPLTDAVNRTMGAVKTTAGAMNSHTLTPQSHSKAIQLIRSGIQDIDSDLAEVRGSITGMQTQISALSNPSSPVPITVATNNSLICTQHPSNSLPPPKRPRGNGARSGNQRRGPGSCVTPIVVQDSAGSTLASNPVLCPPLADAQSQTVVFTVTCRDQDPVETSRCVATAIPGVGGGSVSSCKTDNSPWFCSFAVPFSPCSNGLCSPTLQL
ncbi:hypothetical protein IW262DRAFT_890515 [Armillaria fumosa]|nr:hypothetical protein IW262DRAFT_890515 [Armillaria fumosa]